MISKNQIKFVKQLEMKKHRQREGLFVAEGPKVVGDLLAAGFEPHTIYATEEWGENLTSQPSPQQLLPTSCASSVSCSIHSRCSPCSASATEVMKPPRGP